MPRKSNKLSFVERKRMRQQRKEEKKHLLFLEYLEREIKYGSVTRRKQEIAWKELLTKIGLEKMRDDLEYTWHLFEWTLDIKDCVISALMDELDRINEQYSVCTQNHNMVILRLLNTMNEQQKSTYEYFLESLEKLKKHNQQQYEQYEKKCEDAHNCMNAVIYRMSADHENFIRDRKARFFCNVESYIATFNAKESYEEISGKTIKKLWSKSSKILNQRISTCEYFASAMLKDRLAAEQSDIITRKNLKKMAYFTDTLRRLQSKLTSLHATEGENLKQVTKLHEDFSMYFLILKDKLFQENRRDEFRTKLMICSAETVMEHFRRALEKGKMILRALSLNRKYETLTEKVLPFPVKKSHWKRSFSMMDTTTVSDKLLLFYQKVAAVGASRMTLNEERKFLQMERAKLKRKFAEFCGCLDCNSKNPRIKQEKKYRTFGLSGNTDLITIFRWKKRSEEDEIIKEKLQELKRDLKDDGGSEVKIISSSVSIEISDSGSLKKIE